MSYTKQDVIIFKAMADENRLLILQLLQESEKCACELLKHLNISQSSLSYHMNILCASGIVEAKQVGKWIHYKINKKGRLEAIARFEHLTKVD